MKDKCPFREGGRCNIWIDYQVLQYALQEAEELTSEYSDGGNRPNRQLVPTNPGKCSNGSGIGTVNYFP